MAGAGESGRVFSPEQEARLAEIVADAVREELRALVSVIGAYGQDGWRAVKFRYLPTNWTPPPPAESRSDA